MDSPERVSKGTTNAKRPSYVHGAFREFANGTSMHGVPRIINARSLTGRIFWSIICLGAFGMFFWQCGILLQRFCSYPKKVNVEIIQQPVPFPAVTVCNVDHLDIQMVEKIEGLFNGDEWNQTGFVGPYSEFSQSVLDYMMAKDIFDMPERRGIRPDIVELLSRLGLVANIGPALASSIGIKIVDFIINCHFLDDECDIVASFTKLFDPYYFNCFTFEPQRIRSTTRLQGIEHGLSLLLFTGSAGQLEMKGGTNQVVPGMQEPDSALASGRGARVIVHTPDTQPYPTAEGFDIPPGFSVTIGVKARENVRIDQPHGNCSDRKSPYIEKRIPYKYTLYGCQNDCIQTRIMKKCKCVDNRISLPYDMQDLRFCLQLPESMKLCANLTDEVNCLEVIRSIDETLQCRRKVYEDMTVKNLQMMDECGCHPPCRDIVYDASYSLSTLPETKDEHLSFFVNVDPFFESLDPNQREILDRKYKSKGNDTNPLMKHISRLNVHIADGNIMKTTEAPDYEFIRLVSDIGGQLGLWIGISVMTLFEVLQLCCDVFRFLTTRERDFGAKRNSPKRPPCCHNNRVANRIGGDHGEEALDHLTSL